MVWRIISVLAAGLLAVAILAYGYVLGGWFTPKISVEEHTQKIQSGFSLSVPQTGTGPFPIAVIVPGCLGTRAHHENWSDFFVEAGWATLTIDSFGPRGIVDLHELKTVCEGGRPWGFERAADVVSSIAFLSQYPNLDQSKIALFGWSNGAWAVMDALSFGRRSVPTNLSDLDQNWGNGIRGVGLFYPYCGFGSRSRSRGWNLQPQTLLFVAGRDENVSASECVETAKRLQLDGVEIETVELRSSTHWFDNPRDFELLTHEYDAIAVELVGEHIRMLLGSIETAGFSEQSFTQEH